MTQFKHLKARHSVPFEGNDFDLVDGRDGLSAFSNCQIVWKHESSGLVTQDVCGQEDSDGSDEDEDPSRDPDDETLKDIKGG